MSISFSAPWSLLLLPVCLAFLWWTDRRFRLGVPSLKRRVSLWARVLLTCMLVLSLSAPSVLMAAGHAERWVLLDRSDSAAPIRGELEQTLQTAFGALPVGEEAGVIAFGRQAMVEAPMSDAPALGGVQAQLDADASDLDAALRLAAALSPSSGVTVLTDGRATVSAATAEALAARGVRVDAFIVPPPEVADAQLSALDAPTTAYEGQTLTLTATIDATQAMAGTLVLYQNGVPTVTREVQLSKGVNRLSFTDQAQQTGVVTYEARILCTGDAQSRNNANSAYVRVSGMPKLMLVSNTAAVETLFSAAGMQVERVSPAALPASADGYLRYDGIILNNIDYASAAERQWQALAAAVRELGKGLCVLGGDSSFALGGYRGTVLEELLPVRIDVKQTARIPALTLLLLIDKSGSMSMGRFGVSLIEVAKEAAISATEVLTERDLVGVIAFDDAAQWVVPVQPAADVAGIQSLIGTIRADGGTAFYSPLVLALEAMAQAQTPQKHVIMLSDGAPGDTGYQDVALSLMKAGATLTTVAVGADADEQVMTLLSTLGGGRSYVTSEFDDIPKIFTKETMRMSGSYVQNRTFTPIITETSALTSFEGFPVVDGYLTTAEKTAATVSLVTDTDDPLLAHWQAGAGRVLAWMSDAEGAWTERLLRWQDAPRFFGGMAAAVLPTSGGEGELEASITENVLTITYTLSGVDASDLPTSAVVLAPDGTRQSVPLIEVEPNRYEGQTEVSEQGAYALRVTQVDGDTERVQEGGAVKRFAREYDIRAQGDGETLQKLVSQTGGQLLSGASELWRTPVIGTRERRSLTTLLTLLSLLLLILDIAIRRLPWEAVIERLLPKARQEKAASPASSPKTKAKPQPPEKTQAEKAAATAEALLSAKRKR